MSFLLDTCVLSEFLRKRPSEKVVGWVDVQLEDLLFLSVLTTGEIRKGISKLKPSKRKNELEAWLLKVQDRYGPRILPISVTVADRWGRIKAVAETAGKPLSVIDSLIAATALVHGLTVVTRNEADFAPSGVKLLNIWN
jgi:predicted nucleic acid-binding protein